MTLVERVDDFGKPAWIAAIVISFVMFWPLGLVLLGFAIGSRRVMGCWTNRSGDPRGDYRGGDRWQRRMDRMQRGVDRMQEGIGRMQAAAERWRGMGRRDDRPNGQANWGPAPASSGNHAFDEYRSETLRRLEDEQREFLGFLERLRHAKDKAEFDQFMAERRRYPEAPQQAPPTQQ